MPRCHVVQKNNKRQSQNLLQLLEYFCQIIIKIVFFIDLYNISMGSSQSAEVPGGGSEGYHVLRVGVTIYIELPVYFVSTL